jgi:hypothetical protein
MNRMYTNMLVIALLLAVAATALASGTWYVNGVNGNDSDDCKTPTTACKTIGHAISLASSGDSVIVTAATYRENLNIAISLTVIGSSARTTIIDGGSVSTVVTISSSTARVHLSNVTLRNGHASRGAGINNGGILTISNSTVSGNIALGNNGGGAGILNTGSLTINNTSITANTGIGTGFFGGGILNSYILTIKNSTIAGNAVSGGFGAGFGGGIGNLGTATVINSTLSGNRAQAWGGGIGNEGTLIINNSTISGNQGSYGGGVTNSTHEMTLQNSIIANNSGGNCYAYATITSNGYNLSSDGTCNFNSRGDLNNHDPMLGPLQNNGGPTQTMALSPGSPAIDAGNPAGCKDAQGNLLTTDQRGQPRPDKEDKTGCDIGAFESPSD